MAQTVTLDKKKAIDVAKIIRNEKRLTQLNRELLETIRKQDSVISKLVRDNVIGLDRLDTQNNQISFLEHQIEQYDNLDNQMDFKSKKFYVSFNTLILENKLMPTLGLLYVGKKLLIGGGVGYEEKPIYNINLGVSLF